MKKINILRIISGSGMKSVLASVLCVMMLAAAAPMVNASESEQRRSEQRRDNHNNNGRGNNGHGQRREQAHRPQQAGQAQQGRRPESAQRPQQSQKPQQPQRPQQAQRPQQGNPGPGHNNGRPGQVPGNNFAPGNNGHGNNGHKWSPGKPNQVRPGMAIHRPPVAPPPARPHRPAHFYGFKRPVPPPSWRPGPRPLFSTVLGLAFGSAISAGIDALISGGYVVDGYSNNMVYVNNAVQLNMRWPYAALQYNPGGYLESSQFVYDSPRMDLSRYRAAFNRLVALYGAPVTNHQSGINMSATWWGAGGQYVTLTFDCRPSYAGPDRFFTTLSFGV